MGEGWVGVTHAQGRIDYSVNPFAIAKYVIVPETNHPVSIRFHNRGTRSVGHGFVLPTVDLDDQLRSVAGKIRDKMADRNLMAEVEAGKMLAQ